MTSIAKLSATISCFASSGPIQALIASDGVNLSRRCLSNANSSPIKPIYSLSDIFDLDGENSFDQEFNILTV